MSHKGQSFNRLCYSAWNNQVRARRIEKLSKTFILRVFSDKKEEIIRNLTTNENYLNEFIYTSWNDLFDALRLSLKCYKIN